VSGDRLRVRICAWTGSRDEVYWDSDARLWSMKLVTDTIEGRLPRVSSLGVALTGKS
jgi:hypothetical protein